MTLCTDMHVLLLDRGNIVTDIHHWTDVSLVLATCSQWCSSVGPMLQAILEHVILSFYLFFILVAGSTSHSTQLITGFASNVLFVICDMQTSICYVASCAFIARWLFDAHYQEKQTYLSDYELTQCLYTQDHSFTDRANVSCGLIMVWGLGLEWCCFKGILYCLLRNWHSCSQHKHGQQPVSYDCKDYPWARNIIK